MMDGETARIAVVAGSTLGALGVYGLIIKFIWKRQNRDHDCIIGLKKDTEYIREKMDGFNDRMDAMVKAINELNGKRIL